MTQIADTLLKLLNQFSVTGTEGPMQELIAQRIAVQTQSCAASVKIFRHKQSLVVFTQPSAPRAQDIATGDLILILGHTDTVPGALIPARIEGDHIIGLGASDMKSGLAIMLELLRPEVLNDVKYPLAFVFYAGEEGLSENNELGSVMDAFPELEKAKLALFAEPTDRTIQLGCLGLINIKVVFSGVAAHSARPWNGVNAIQRAGLFLTALDKMEPKRIAIGPVEYVEVSTVTLAKGGTAANVVPASFELNLNVRIAPGTNPQQRVAELQQLAGPDVKFDVYDSAPAGRVPTDNSVYEKFKNSVAVPEAPKQAYTDVGLLSERALDAINFGPGLTGQCHVTHEFAKLSDIEWCFAKYRNFLCGK